MYKFRVAYYVAAAQTLEMSEANDPTLILVFYK